MGNKPKQFHSYVSFVLEKDLYEKAKRQALAEGNISFSKLMRHALENYLKQKDVDTQK